MDVTISEGNQVFGLIGTTLNAMLKARRKELEPTGLSIAQTWALWSLVILGRPTTVAEMAQIMDRDHQTTSQLLRRMEKDGLVQRRSGPHKANPIEVAITPRGKGALETALETSRIIDDIVSCLSKQELDTLRGYLEKLRENAVARAAVHFIAPSPFGIGVANASGGHGARDAR